MSYFTHVNLTITQKNDKGSAPILQGGARRTHTGATQPRGPEGILSPALRPFPLNFNITIPCKIAS